MMINKFKKKFTLVNFSLTVLTFCVIIFERVFTYISYDVFFRFFAFALILSIVIICIEKIKFLNKLFIKIVFFIVVSVNIWMASSWIYTINGYIIVIPQNYRSRIYITTNDEHSEKRIRPYNGVVVLAVNSKGRLSTRSNFDIAESQTSVMEFKNDRLVENDKIELSEFKVATLENKSNKQLLLTATVKIDSTSVRSR